MLQTFLSSSPLRNWGPNPMVQASEELILDCGKGVFLSGFLSKVVNRNPKGLVILLHGWEGSADSAYMIGTGKKLYTAGFDVFRLNYRDHGNSHHLNKGIFNGTLIEETFVAVLNVAENFNRTEKLFITGLSLGGSFALRIAKLHGLREVKNLKRIISINPPLDPYDATVRIDRYPLIRKHFLKKWKSSLKIKESVFPGIYDFSDLWQINNCLELTDILIPRYSDYTDAIDYFNHYTLKKNILNQAAVPVTLITSEDDPIIKVEDFKSAEINENINLEIHPFGGHCGYIENLNLDSWYNEKILSLLN
ncbi:MAG: alpha/beta fold hydrolase [Spirochaetaceae bacterium]|jgi:predicted alpha/beta-fold hydrolase|nr:alpha/beta fold hydrolase [Spirochaetaceae bacterium]